jgi:L-alanine-DL-glutamate epimerase-like enolase superfamily enzyme
MLQWSIEPVRLELRYTWKISRNASDEKTNLIVTVTDGMVTARGEAAPNVRYGESPERLQEEFVRFAAATGPERRAPEDVACIARQAGCSNALRFAIESAAWHFHSGNRRESLYQSLAVDDPGDTPTSYTIPILDPGQLREFYDRERLSRFRYLKLKVDRDTAFEATRHLCSFAQVPVMVDANEAFTDVEELIRLLERLRRLPIEFVEQAMPDRLREESIYLKKYCPFPHFADEAVTDEPDMEFIRSAYHGVNMKLMKAGGYGNGLRILREAKRLGLRTMIGCMVETTLGIGSALHLCSLADYADLDSFLLLKQEPFGLVHEQEGVLNFSRTGH